LNPGPKQCLEFLRFFRTNELFEILEASRFPNTLAKMGINIQYETHEFEENLQITNWFPISQWGWAGDPHYPFATALLLNIPQDS
jgi:hypothetical protein